RQRWMLLSVFQHIPTLSPLQSTGCESPAAPAAPAAFSAASGSLAAVRLTGGTRIDVSLASAMGLSSTCARVRPDAWSHAPTGCTLHVPRTVMLMLQPRCDRWTT